MKNIFIILLSFYTLIASAQQDKAHQDLIMRERSRALSKMLRQTLANTGNYDIKFHRLVLTPSLTSRYLSGEVTTYFVPNQDISQIEFDLNDQMAVQSVTQRGNNLNFSQSNNKLIIDFSTPVTSGTLDSISIQYSGIVPNSGMGSYTVTTHYSVPTVWTLSEPYGARDWWPCKQDLTDKADSLEVIIQYDRYYNSAEMMAVSNGIITDDYIITNTAGNPDIRVTTWKHRYPIAAYLVAFAVSNYTKFSQTAGINQSFPIDNYVYPESLTDAQAQSSTFVPVMNYFEQSFGHYPFNNEKYGQVEFGWGGGMEHQTATFLISFNRSLVAHELAHQWFGDAITCGSWHDIWLNEGFATYAEALTREHFDGQQAFDTWKEDANSYITSEPGGAVYTQDTTNIWRIFDGRLSYRKGAMVLNMLRLKLGDNDFFQGLRNYVVNKSFQYALTPDFQAEMENQSGQNLSEFFNDWIYGEGYPTYNITVNKTAPHQYTVTVNQNTSHPSVDFFEMPLPFVFSDNNGNNFEIVLDHTSNGQVFQVDTGFEITDVVFDPHHDIVKGSTSMNVILNKQILPASAFKIFPNPAGKYIVIENRSDSRIQRIFITDINGKTLMNPDKNSLKINLENLSKGTYMLKILTDKGYFIDKILKR